MGFYDCINDCPKVIRLLSGSNIENSGQVMFKKVIDPDEIKNLID